MELQQVKNYYKVLKQKADKGNFVYSDEDFEDTINLIELLIASLGEVKFYKKFVIELDTNIKRCFLVFGKSNYDDRFIEIFVNLGIIHLNVCRFDGNVLGALYLNKDRLDDVDGLYATIVRYYNNLFDNF